MDRIRRYWGEFVLSMSQMGLVIGLFTLAFSAIAAFPTVQDWALRINIQLTLWQYGIAAVILIVSGLQLIKKLGTPNYIREWNKQWWLQENPLKTYLEKELKNDIREVIRQELENSNQKKSEESRLQYFKKFSHKV